MGCWQYLQPLPNRCPGCDNQTHLQTWTNFTWKAKILPVENDYTRNFVDQRVTQVRERDQDATTKEEVIGAGNNAGAWGMEGKTQI